MNIFRTIGYIGIAILLVIAALGTVLAIANHDWYGFTLMVAFFCILAFLGYGLRSAARREKNPELAKESGLGWYGESVSSLFCGPVLHTSEGLILIGGSLISLLFAVITWIAPSWVALHPSRSSVNAPLFAMWPVLLFVIYVKSCAPNFRSNIFTSLVMLCAAGLPFYMVYK